MKNKKIPGTLLFKMKGLSERQIPVQICKKKKNTQIDVLWAHFINEAGKKIMFISVAF